MKKSATIIVGTIGIAFALFVILNLVVPWNSPVRMILSPRQYRYNQLLHNAMANYQAGKMDIAATYFEKLLKQKPEDAKLHYRMGVVKSRLGETDEAIAEFDKAFELSGREMGEAPASVAAIHIQQGEDLLKKDNPRDAGTFFDRANERLDAASEAVKNRETEEWNAVLKEFSLLRGQVFIGQGLSALLYSDRADVAVERFSAAESVFKNAEALKPFREYRKLSHAYAELARVHGKSYMDEQAARKYWEKSFAVMELAMAAAHMDKKHALKFGDSLEVFRSKYRKELKALKKEARGGDKTKKPAPAPAPEKLDSAIEIFE
jgi:tetratricopeptide (TPR) repeat protein